MGKSNADDLSSADIIKNAQGVHATVIKVGGHNMVTAKLPTGIFELDLALLGGLPRGKVTTIYGAESAAKTTLVLRTIGIEQKRNPEKKCVFVDIENSFDPVWAKKLGVDIEELILVKPMHAEQAVDLVCAFMAATDVAIVALDSIAALVTSTEADDSAEKAEVGKRALLVGKLYRKSNYEMNRQELEGRQAPSLILINQFRLKIGVMHGNPETLPGGMSFKFGSSLVLRLYGKGEMDSKVSNKTDTFRKVSAIVKKHKFPIAAKNVEYKLTMVPHKKLSYGDSPDWNTVSSFAKTYGLLIKEGPEWQLCGMSSKVLAPLEEHYYSDAEFGQTVRDAVMLAVAEEHGMED